MGQAFITRRGGGGGGKFKGWALPAAVSPNRLESAELAGAKNFVLFPSGMFPTPVVNPDPDTFWDFGLVIGVWVQNGYIMSVCCLDTLGNTQTLDCFYDDGFGNLTYDSISITGLTFDPSDGSFNCDPSMVAGLPCGFDPSVSYYGYIYE